MFGAGRLMSKSERCQSVSASPSEEKPTDEMTKAELEAWRAANPWPWFEELRAYTLVNSTPEVREYQMQWEPLPVHLDTADVGKER